MDLRNVISGFKSVLRDENDHYKVLSHFPRTLRLDIVRVLLAEKFNLKWAPRIVDLVCTPTPKCDPTDIYLELLRQFKAVQYNHPAYLTFLSRICPHVCHTRNQDLIDIFMERPELTGSLIVYNTNVPYQKRFELVQRIEIQHLWQFDMYIAYFCPDLITPDRAEEIFTSITKNRDYYSFVVRDFPESSYYFPLDETTINLLFKHFRSDVIDSIGSEVPGYDFAPVDVIEESLKSAHDWSWPWNPFFFKYITRDLILQYISVANPRSISSFVQEPDMNRFFKKKELRRIRRTVSAALKLV